MRLKINSYNAENYVFISFGDGSVQLIPTNPDALETYKYKFNSQEWQSEFNLNVYDYGARIYTPDAPRFWQMDPHAESYYSVSPYSSFANNPISFIDPTGKDILFWRFISDGDGGGYWKQVTYDQLDKKSQKAIENFAKTKIGREFLGAFAKKGDKIGSVEFTETGKYADHNWNFGEYNDPASSAEASIPFPRAHSTYIDFYTHFNTAIENSTDINILLKILVTKYFYI